MAQLITINLQVIGYSSVTAYPQSSNTYSTSGTVPAWLTVDFSTNYSDITLNVLDNNTGSDRNAFIHLFGNTNLGNVPDATIHLLQAELQVDIKVTNYNITGGINAQYDDLDSVSVYQNAGVIPNVGVENAGIFFTADNQSSFSDVANGLTSGGGQIASVQYFDENNNLLSTQNNLQVQSGGQWLSIAGLTSGTNATYHPGNFTVPVNPPGNQSRKAVVTFRHPTALGVQDTATIEQARGYDPTKDTVKVLCEETIPQTFISTNTPTVGTASGSFTSVSYGSNFYGGTTFLVDDNPQNLNIEFLVQTDGSTINQAPLVTLDAFDHDLQFGNSTPLAHFASLSSNGIEQPAATQSSYNFYHNIFLNKNDTFADRKFRVKAHHPNNTTFPSGSDGFMEIVQKAFPIAWFPLNGEPSNLSYTGDNITTGTYLAGTGISPTQYLTSNVIYEPGISSQFNMLVMNGSILDNLLVKTSGDKAPLVKVVKYGEYDAASHTGPGPGFPSQSVSPGYFSSNSLNWTGQSTPNSAAYATNNDLDIWPFNGDGNLVDSIKYRNIYSTTAEDTYSNFITNSGTSGLDDDHNCTVKVTFNAPSPTARRYFALGVWHFSKVDYSDMNNIQPLATYVDDPDDLIWLYQDPGAVDFECKSGGTTILSNDRIVGQLPDKNISATVPAGNVDVLYDDNGNIHEAFSHQIKVKHPYGGGVNPTNVNVYFYTAYHTSSFSPATIDNLTALTGATTIASNSTWGTNSLATWSGTAWSSTYTTTGTWQSAQGVYPQVTFTNTVNNQPVNNLPVSNATISNDLNLNILLPQNNTGQVRKLRVVVESTNDSRHRIFQDIIQSA